MGRYKRLYFVFLVLFCIVITIFCVYFLDRPEKEIEELSEEELQEKEKAREEYKR